MDFTWGICWNYVEWINSLMPIQSRRSETGAKPSKRKAFGGSLILAMQHVEVLVLPRFDGMYITS